MSKMKVAKVDYVESDHGPIYNFFYSFWTHILQLMSVNVLLIIFNIPAMILGYFMSLVILPRLNSLFEVNNFIAFMEENGITGNDTLLNDIAGADAAVQFYFLFVVFCVIFLVSSSLVCIGPFQAGFSQIYRNCRRQSGIFFFPDFKEGIKNNWKQSLVASLISIVIVFVDLIAVGFYINSGNSGGAFIAGFFIAFFFVFMLVQNIVYQTIVSREMPLRKIYRNAFLFILLNFGPCLAMIGFQVLMLLVIPFILILNTSYLTLGIFLFLYGFIAIAFVQYLAAFFTGGMLHKFMPTPKNEEETDADAEESVETEKEAESETDE